MNNKKTISVRVVSLGSDTTINILEGDRVIDVLKRLNSKVENICVNGKRVSKDYILENDDLIIFADTIKGAVSEKYKGVKWMIHKKDIDDKIFHAHDYENGTKLNLKTGEIFRKKIIIKKLKNKELIQFLIKIAKRSKRESDMRKKLLVIVNSRSK